MQIYVQIRLHIKRLVNRHAWLMWQFIIHKQKATIKEKESQKSLTYICITMSKDLRMRSQPLYSVNCKRCVTDRRRENETNGRSEGRVRPSNASYLKLPKILPTLNSKLHEIYEFAEKPKTTYNFESYSLSNTFLHNDQIHKASLWQWTIKYIFIWWRNQKELTPTTGQISQSAVDRKWFETARAQLGGGPAFHTLARNMSLNWGGTHFQLELRPCIISSVLLWMYLRPPLKINQ